MEPEITHDSDEGVEDHGLLEGVPGACGEIKQLVVDFKAAEAGDQRAAV